MKKLLLVSGLVGMLATAQAAGFAATHHAMKAKVQVLATHTKALPLHHHAKAACPSTPKCKCD